MVSGIGADPPGEWQVVHRVERIARISRAKVIFVVIGSCARRLRDGSEQQQEGSGGREATGSVPSTFYRVDYCPPPGRAVMTAPGATPSIE